MTLLTISTFCLSLLAAPATPPVAVSGQQDTKATPAAAAQERDVICGMSVDTAKAKADGRTSTYEGKTYYFCNDSCKKQFDAEPAKYAAQKTGQAQTGDGCGCCCCRNGGGMAGGAMAGAGTSGGMGGGMCGRRRMP